MSKLNRKGFTLIELLAVITIMGILMVVAIPSVSRTIENTRRDSFLDTAKNYANGVKTMWISDSLKCGGNFASAVAQGTYYVPIDSTKAGTTDGGVNYPMILDQGGTSSWGNAAVKGYVKIVVTAPNTGTAKVTYHIYLADGAGHGITNVTEEAIKLTRSDVSTSGVSQTTTLASATICQEV